MRKNRGNTTRPASHSFQVYVKQIAKSVERSRLKIIEKTPRNFFFGFILDIYLCYSTIVIIRQQMNELNELTRIIWQKQYIDTAFDELQREKTLSVC